MSSLKEDEAMKLLNEIRSAQKALEDRLSELKEELTEAIEDTQKDLLKLDAFCHNILEENQKTIYSHVLKIEGQEAEEEEGAE